MEALGRRPRDRARVNQHHRLPPVKLRHHRVEGGIADIDALVVRQQDHAVGRQRVIGVADRLERAVDVGQRNAGEHAEPVGPVLDQRGLTLVDLAREGARLGIVAEVGAGRGERQDAGGDLMLVHHRQRAFRAPLDGRPGAHAVPVERGDELRRQQMLVDVDPGCIARGRSASLQLRRRCAHAGSGERAGGHAGGENGSPGPSGHRARPPRTCSAWDRAPARTAGDPRRRSSPRD